jgi:excisionase family DNA binding protein
MNPSNRAPAPVSASVPTSPAALEPLLSVEELSEYLHIPVKTLYDWRLSGRGPRAVHVGRQLRYFVTDVHNWLTTQRESAPGRGPESVPGGPRSSEGR